MKISLEKVLFVLVVAPGIVLLWALMFIILALAVQTVVAPCANAETIQLQCTASTSPDVAKHTLYQSKRSDFVGATTKDMPGCETTVVTDGAGPDYFKATATDTNGNESESSNVLVVGDITKPASPTLLKKK